MISIKTFTGARLDLEHFKGYPIIDYEFEILEDDCSVRNFDDSSGVFFKLFAKQGGKLLANIDMLIGDTSPTDNKLYLSDDSVITDMRRPRTYWHEVYSMEGSPEQPVLIFYGNSEL